MMHMEVSPLCMKTHVSGMSPQSLSLSVCVCVLDHQQLFLDNELLFNYVCFPPYNNNKKKTQESSFMLFHVDD